MHIFFLSNHFPTTDKLLPGMSFLLGEAAAGAGRVGVRWRGKGHSSKQTVNFAQQ